jgi:hypothetical protein
MSFKWEDFEILACELSNKPDETSQRTALSRFYYAAFCHCRECLIDSGKTEFKVRQDIYSKVINNFKKGYYEESKKIEEYLKRLRVNKKLCRL